MKREEIVNHWTQYFIGRFPLFTKNLLEKAFKDDSDKAYQAILESFKLTLNAILDVFEKFMKDELAKALGKGVYGGD